MEQFASLPSPEQVVHALFETFSPVEATRKHAEESVTRLTRMPGGCMLLMRVASAGDAVRVEARQAAAIAVKNLVKRTWEDDAIFGSAPDRAAARAAVLGALLRPDCTGAVREQFAECVGQLVFKDFPDRWPELLPTTVAAIRGRSDAVVVHNALLALRKVAKRFEFKARDDDARSPVEAVVAETFPLLRPLLATLTPSAGQHPEAALLAKLVLKIFWSCTQFALPRSTIPRGNGLRPPVSPSVLEERERERAVQRRNKQVLRLPARRRPSSSVLAASRPFRRGRPRAGPLCKTRPSCSSGSNSSKRCSSATRPRRRTPPRRTTRPRRSRRAAAERGTRRRRVVSADGWSRRRRRRGGRDVASPWDDCPRRSSMSATREASLI